MEVLRKKLEACLQILNSTNAGDANWLNDLCALLLDYSTLVHSSLCSRKQNESSELVCLCLSQILTCIRQVENTMKMSGGSSHSASHQNVYFLDRIRWCLKRLLHLHSEDSNGDALTPERSFLHLMDATLDTLALFTSYNEENSDPLSFPQSHQEVLVLSKQLRANIDLILSQSLGFANVALSQDKRALSALCQKVIRECNAFQVECKVPSASYHSVLKLRAMTLEQALYQLEDFINDALLRLVFTCFLDFDKFSVDKIRNLLRKSTEDDAVADEFIADFDVNIDRATQIGIFAISFAPSLKMKTMMRSCLASFESLDTSLIPSLQAHGSELHSDILEQHFTEEVAKFKAALQEIIDSRALLGCCLEILSSGISATEKLFDKQRLEDLAQVSLILIEHFQLEVNRKGLTETKNQAGEEYYAQFIRILRECKAILMCASQVEPQRILKRFKILRTILRKLHGCLGVGQQEEKHPNPLEPLLVVETSDPNGDNADLTQFTRRGGSILYDTERRTRVNRTKDNKLTANTLDIKSEKAKPNGNVLRRESLRTVMFKRQNIAESRKMYTTISNQSTDLEITDILEQLTGMSNGYFEC
ncbi:serendipity locus protein alpha [Drosophila takahashii]|uniref:serendipity locus protein alpha n=1 Tax=Drosophila takahashii TaxID=29030 RepID=UPI001CF8A924|nr:LOW QUALITY PROTEIN: serendipity locus protein alpha [Drosophila takahashii]